MINKLEINELVNLTKNLINIKSLSGNEKGISDFIKKYMGDDGFNITIDEYGNTIFVLKVGNGDGPNILLDAHMDTVDANLADWENNPFNAKEKNGQIFGRGASDMKGALACILSAGKYLSKKENNKELNGNIIISSTTWEEYFEGYCLTKVIEYLKKINLIPDYVIIGEASECNIKRGQRGRARVEVIIRGEAAHSAHPETGINSVYQATKFIQKIYELKKEKHEFLGEQIIECIGIDSFPQPVDSVVPYLSRITYDLRLLLGDSKDSILKIFQKIIDEMKTNDFSFKAEAKMLGGDLTKTDGTTEYIQTFPLAWEISESHILVKSAMSALKSIYGFDPIIISYGFCTSGSGSAGTCGIPTIGFGPGKESSAHIKDESIYITELEKATNGYIAIIKNLLSNNELD